MRIISKFQDYYDGVMAYGQDRSITWIRNTEEIETDTEKLGINDSWFRSYSLQTKRWISYAGRGYNNVHESYVALAGKIYPIHIGNFKDFPDEVKLIGSDYKEIRQRLINFSKENITVPRNDPENYEPDFGWSWKRTNGAERQAWVDKPCHDLHTAFDCPLLWITKDSIIKCPNLKAMCFQKIRDPFNVFQDIAMYISGVMGQQTNPMVEISDKSKILKRGLDPKWSFRTRPKEGR